MTNITVFNNPDANGMPLQLGKDQYIAKGGEGTVYKVLHPDQTKEIAIKIFNKRKFKSEADRNHLRKKIDTMVKMGNNDNQALIKFPEVAWPQILVYNEDGQFCGYGMQYIEGEPLTRLAHFQMYKTYFLDMDREKVAHMLIRLWQSAKFLHDRKIYIGDVNQDNVLCTKKYGICWIDVDSFQIEGFPCMVGRPDMTPPEHNQENQYFREIKRNAESDRFSLAILSFLCFMLGCHPYNRIGGSTLVENFRSGHFPYKSIGTHPDVPKGPWYKIWSHYTYDIKNLFVNMFTEGRDPNNRASAEEWVHVLRQYIKQLQCKEPLVAEDGGGFGCCCKMVPDAVKPPLETPNIAYNPTSLSSNSKKEEAMTNSNNDLIENPTPRCPCMLVLDVSNSMEGEKIARLNEGVRQFLKEVCEDEFAIYSVELGVVTFGGNVKTSAEFGSPSEMEWKDLGASGRTPMGEAVNKAILALDKRKQEYADNGVSYYQPWLVLMSDGRPTDDYLGTAAKLRSLANDKKIIVFGVGIGENCNMNVLSEFCPEKRPPARLDGLKFKEFFAWLSQSMSRVNQSAPGAEVHLETPPLIGWDIINK